MIESMLNQDAGATHQENYPTGRQETDLKIKGEFGAGDTEMRTT